MTHGELVMFLRMLNSVPQKVIVDLPEVPEGWTDEKEGAFQQWLRQGKPGTVFVPNDSRPNQSDDEADEKAWRSAFNDLLEMIEERNQIYLDIVGKIRAAFPDAIGASVVLLSVGGSLRVGRLDFDNFWEMMEDGLDVIIVGAIVIRPGGEIAVLPVADGPDVMKVLRLALDELEKHRIR